MLTTLVWNSELFFLGDIILSAGMKTVEGLWNFEDYGEKLSENVLMML